MAPGWLRVSCFAPPADDRGKEFVRTARPFTILMTEFKDWITVCICTHKRPEFLARLLEALGRQETRGRFGFSIIVVDNDPRRSAEAVVRHFAEHSSLETNYLVEAKPNIAAVRNKAVNAAKGSHLAFIDDDEFPGGDWLRVLLETCASAGAGGVLGPVLPHFESEPPRWLVKAGFYDRARHGTGFVPGWREARTGNVLIRRKILEGMTEAFRPEFGAGGEDQDFFRRMMEAGHVFVWCDEAPVHETVPPHRWARRFLLKRALLRGHTTFLHGQNRLKFLAKSLVAVPVYLVGLPVLLLMGHHHFMKYLVRLFDHIGRLLALVNLNPVRQRDN